MENNRTGHRARSLWLATLAGSAGFWLWTGNGGGAAMLSGAAALVLTAVFGLVWLSRARAARRFHAAVEAYAAREIARQPLGNGPRGVRGVPARHAAVR